MAIEYVDKKGLSHFWERIKSAVSSKKAVVTQTVTTGTKIATVDGVDIFAPEGTGGTLYAAPGAKKSVYNFDIIDGNAHFLVAVGENYGDQPAVSPLQISSSVLRCDEHNYKAPPCVRAVDWGDGTVDTDFFGSVNHKYAHPGVYEVIYYAQTPDVVAQYASTYMTAFSKTVGNILYNDIYAAYVTLAVSLPDGIDMALIRENMNGKTFATLMVFQGGITSYNNTQASIAIPGLRVKLLSKQPVFSYDFLYAFQYQPKYVDLIVPYIYAYTNISNLNLSNARNIIESEVLPLKSITIPDTTVNVSDFMDAEGSVTIPVLLNEKNDVNYADSDLTFVIQSDNTKDAIKSMKYERSLTHLPQITLTTNANVKDESTINIWLGRGSITYKGTLTLINKRSTLTAIRCKSEAVAYNIASPLDIDYIGDGVYPVAIADRGVTAEVIAGTGTVEVTDGKVMVTATDGDSITVRITSTSNPSISKEAVLKVDHKSVSINLNSQWQAKEGSTVDGHQVYQSFSNYHVSGGRAKATLTLTGYAAGSTVKLYIRSYAESSYDYVIVGKVNQTLASNASYSSSSVLAHTRDNQSATTYTEVDLVTQTDSDTVEIVYLKDGVGDSNDDRGYFYVNAPISEVTA